MIFSGMGIAEALNLLLAGHVNVELGTAVLDLMLFLTSSHRKGKFFRRNGESGLIEFCELVEAFEELL